MKMFKEIVKQNFEKCDWTKLAGEEIELNVIKLANYFSDATQANGCTEQQKAKLYFVTEGRHNSKGYSSCADLAHCILSLMGITNKKIVNRNDDNFNDVIDNDEKLNQWAPSKNISMLVWGSKDIEKSLNQQLFVDGTSDTEPTPGSLVIIGGSGLGGPEHVFVCTGIDDNVIMSVDAGQIDLGGQCIKTRKRKLYRSGGRWWVKSMDQVTGPSSVGSGGRAILGWIDVGVVARLITTEGLCVR